MRLEHEGYQYVPDDSAKRNQLGFHKSDALIRLAFGGNQSGKSRTAAEEIKMWFEGSHKYLDIPKAPKIYVVSALYQTHLEGIYRHLMGGQKGGKSDKAILFDWMIDRVGPNHTDANMPKWITSTTGAVMNFLSAQGGESARRAMQAAAVDLVVIDEEVEEMHYTELLMRMLAKGGKMVISTTLVESHEWLCELEDRADSGDKDVALFRFDTGRALEAGHVKKKQFDMIFGGMSDGTIWKFELKPMSGVLEMPKGAHVLSVQTQRGTPCLWAFVDPESPTVPHSVRIHGTGWPLSENIDEYVGTFQVEGETLVFHVFVGEEKPQPGGTMSDAPKADRLCEFEDIARNGTMPKERRELLLWAVEEIERLRVQVVDTQNLLEIATAALPDEEPPETFTST